MKRSWRWWSTSAAMSFTPCSSSSLKVNRKLL